MTLASLEAAIPEGDRILLDSSTLIAHLNGGEAASPAADHIVNEWVRGGRNSAVVSMISVMELLVRPLRRGPVQDFHTAFDFLTRTPNMRAAPVDLHVAQEAAGLRAALQFSPPDALTVATGIVAQVGHLVTNDRRWQRLPPIRPWIRVCYLEDHLPFP